ncbi:MAG TPA: DUF2239 family protein [Caulobacteraceae bacterium]|nr:DUF2239 family protein [Caulobacteraceae bacterium]
MADDAPSYVVFCEGHRLGIGSLVDVAMAAKRFAGAPARPLIALNLETGEIVDLDLRGGFAEIRTRYARAPKVRRGRPKLGVTAREVTLLPRHWDWLARQPGGASAALRRLVEHARKDSQLSGERQAARDAAYGLMKALAGDRPGFEEACRALFRGDEGGLLARMQGWPPDVRLTVIERLRVAASNES